MTYSNDIPPAVIRGALVEIYQVAEGLYRAHGCEIPAGRSFARSLDSLANHCYHAAVVVYYNHLSGSLGRKMLTH